MKLSDYIASFLEKLKVKDVYVLTGGCAVHIIDSIAKRNNIQYIPVQHEQSGAMAADASSRLNSNLGVVVATSGPGATNLLTGICCSFYDSIPVLAITGQVPRGQLKGNSKSRQIGFQETDVVSIFSSITKYSKLITDPQMIRYELEKAVYLAKNDRPGPVLLDICDDIQRADVNPQKLKSFTPPKKNNIKLRSFLNLSLLKEIVGFIKNSKRPLLVIGAGVRLAKVNNINEFIDKLGIPFTLTWGAADLVSHHHKLYTSNFGVTSSRAGNFTIQNSDLIITIGTRLDTHEVGSNIKTFARDAKRVVVDIDPAEQKKYKKMGFKVDLLVNCDAKLFIDSFLRSKVNINKNQEINLWFNQIRKWKKLFPLCDEISKNQKKWVNPYYFINKLSELSKSGQVTMTDCGSNLIWTMQAYKIKQDQRVISAWNHSPMGYSLPASIGAAFARPDEQIHCISGDGGMQINIQELATIYRHKLNIVIFVLNNHCHGIIQGTQENWLDARYHASDPKYGKLPDPNFSKIANAYGIKSLDIKNNKEVGNVVKFALKHKGPLLVNVHLMPESQIYPKLLFGKPIEDSHPLLPRDFFEKQMIVKPLK